MIKPETTLAQLQVQLALNGATMTLVWVAFAERYSASLHNSDIGFAHGHGTSPLEAINNAFTDMHDKSADKDTYETSS